MTAQAPSAVAANKKPVPQHDDELEEEEEDTESEANVGAKAKDEPKSQGHAAADSVTRHRRRRLEDQGLKSVNLAPVDPSLSNADEAKKAADRNSMALDATPEVVVEAQARLTQAYRIKLARLQEEHLAQKRRSSELDTATKDLMAKLDDISALEDRLQRELGIGKAKREYRGQRIKSLAALIMTMPPQSGARILSNMSERDAQEIVLGMAQKNERKAAKLLAQMPPNKAAELGQRYLSSDRHIKGSNGLYHKSDPPKQKSGGNR